MLNTKHCLIMLLVIIPVFTLTACRQRIADGGTVTETTLEPVEKDNQEKTEEPKEEPKPSPKADNTPPDIDETPEISFEVEINSVEPEEIITPTASEGSDLDTKSDDDESVPMAEKSGDNTLLLQEASDVAGETNLSDDGDGTVGTIIDSYTQLLNSGLGSLYECQKSYVYFEQTTEYLTINRSSPEHKLIVESGGYNCAEKLGGDALMVDSGWVLRKNPAVLIKCVNSDILGHNITDVNRAGAIASEIFARPGLEGASFVINRSVVLISEELLLSDYGRLLAKIYIANAMYPSLFSDVDINALCEQITQAGGEDYTKGIYCYIVSLK